MESNGESRGDPKNVRGCYISLVRIYFFKMHFILLIFPNILRKTIEGYFD